MVDLGGRRSDPEQLRKSKIDRIRRLVCPPLTIENKKNVLWGPDKKVKCVREFSTSTRIGGALLVPVVVTGGRQMQSQRSAKTSPKEIGETSKSSK